MHLRGFSLLLAYLLNTTLGSALSHNDYYEYYEQEQLDEPVSDTKTPDLEQSLRSASSVDELMSLIYPSYWAAVKCKSKLSAAASSSSKLSQQSQVRQLRPLGDTEEPTFAAVYLNLDILKSIESEWRKTQCSPREVCIDVGREFGAPTNVFYKPPCVSVYRCGGCCHSEDKQCRNISTGYLSKNVNQQDVKNLTQELNRDVANNTQGQLQANCTSHHQVLDLPRRCPLANRTCPLGQTWSNRQCSVSLSSNSTDIFSADLCGPNKKLDVESCQCVCHQTQDCGPNHHLNRNTCQCVCNLPPSLSCPQSYVFNKETCQCTCNKTCPRHQPLNKTKCSCECNESPNKCFLKGRRFHQATCSCVRPSCEVGRRRCEPGFFFSDEVCRCVPSHWRRLD
uniref:Vascular endothelial growth factor c n=1 Tax=Haplochromis burtoni TaxID=8153 RepID=A0A3Q2UUH0_HAPBU